MVFCKIWAQRVAIIGQLHDKEMLNMGFSGCVHTTGVLPASELTLLADSFSEKAFLNFLV